MIEKVTNQIEIIDAKDQETLNKWKAITGDDTPPNIEQKNLDLFYCIYRQVNYSNPTEEIKNKIMSCLQYLVMDTRIAEYEKTNMSA